MEINYLGHSCFRFKGKNVTIVTDPFNPDVVGLKLAKQAADIVTISHGHDDHNFRELVKAKDTNMVIFDAPGEYEVGGCSLLAWKTYHDNQKGEIRGPNIVFHFDLDGVKIVHLGDLGHVLSDELLEQMGEVDILFIPVGGHYTIDHKIAASVINAVSPRIAIPMHYYVEGMNQEVFSDLSPVDLFLSEVNKTGLEPVEKLVVNAGNFGEETQIVLMR